MFTESLSSQNSPQGRTALRQAQGPPRAPCGNPPCIAAPRSLGSFVAGFKSTVTTRINQIRNTPGLPVWQRNYHDWIIRDDGMLDRIRAYIAENPGRWEFDFENAIMD